MDAVETISEGLLAPARERLACHAADKDLIEADFEGIVRTHQRRIFRILLLQLRDRDAAETLTQECFLRAYRNWRAFRGEASVSTWLIRIALNLARDHARSRRLAFWRYLGRERAVESPATPGPVLPAPDPSPERCLLARERLTAVWAKVEQLPARQRTCFLLRYVEELPIGEIAETLQLEIGTVKAHLARAVGAVRQHLQEHEQSCAHI